MGLDFDFAKLDARDVLDIAMFIEQEARDRYIDFADHMGRQGNEGAAAFFRRMAGLEARHREQIATKREALFAGQPARYTDDVEWDVEGPEYDPNRTEMTLRQALDIAVRSEQDAYDYYASAMEYLTETAVTEMLDELRLAEVEHKRLLESELAKLG